MQEIRQGVNPNGLHPLVESFGYRDAVPEAGGEPVVYGNPKFQLAVQHTFKSKRGMVAPADIAFMQLVLVATLSGKTLSTFPDAEGTYRAFLLFAKEHLGRHAAVVPATERKRSFVLGKRYALSQLPLRSAACLSLYLPAFF